MRVKGAGGSDDAIIDYKFWDSMQAPNAGHFLVNGVEQVPGTVSTCRRPPSVG